MSYRLRPPEPSGGPFKNPSTTARKSVRSAIPIPTGTVASRVYHLQSLSRATATRDLPSDCSSHPGDSPVGLPKRPNNPFAAIFWRKALPDNVKEVEIAHSPPESTASRGPDEGVHASYDPNQKGTNLQNVLCTNHRTLDNLEGRIRKRERPVHPPVSKGRSSSGTIRGHDAHRLDGPQEEKELRERLQGHLRGVPGPSRTVQSRWRSPPQRPANFRSESSNTTTSTMRRQSVRELFQDNGIERPAGLASPNISEDTSYNLRSSKAHVSCHRCSFKNKFVQIACLKCGHHFCDNCPASSIFPHDPFSHNLISPLSPQKCTGDSNIQGDIQSSSRNSTKRTVSRPHPVAIQHPRKKNYQVQYSTPTIGLASSNLTDSFPGNQSGKEEQHISSTSERHGNAHMKFKDIPRSAMNELSNNTAHQQSTGISHSMRRPGGSWKLSQEEQLPPDTSPDDLDFNNYIPHDTNDAYTSTPVPVTREHQTVIQGEADLCTVIADCHVNTTSQLNEADALNRKTNPYYSKLDPCAERGSISESVHSPLSSPLSAPYHEAGASNNSQQPEYVECYGFPRTGHGRCGSLIQSGIVGDCQHCLDDCECLACQRTQHSVRCCINRDHPSIPHIHQIPQAASRLEETAVLSPLVITPPDIRQLEGQNSPRRSMGKTTPTFKYAVAHIDTVQKRPGKKTVSSGHANHGILMGGRPHSSNTPHRRESNPLTVDEFMRNSQHEILAVQPPGRHPVPYNTIPERHASLLKKTIIMPSRETLRMQAKQKEQQKEGSKQMGQKDMESKTEPTNRRLAKAERKYLKHAAKLEKQEEKLSSYKGDKLPEDRTLVLAYEVGPRIQRQSTPVSGETCAGRKTPTQSFRERSSLTTSKSKDLDYHLNIGRRNHIEAKSNGAGILGITVIVHMSNAEDLIFKVDASMAESKWA